MRATSTLPDPRQERRGPGRLPRRTLWIVVICGLAAVVAAVALNNALPTPTRVKVTVDNQTAYSLLVEMSDGHGGSWAPLTFVDKRAVAVTSEVIDQGDTWQFRFVAQGVEGGQLTVSRDDLRRGGWRITVPPTVGQHFSDAGLIASP